MGRRAVHDEQEFTGASTRSSSATRVNGTVKRLVTAKGFGFIATDDGAEYFFHHSAYDEDFDSLREGAKVTFEKGQGPKGPRAESVQAA